ncbi:MAG: ABC transporter permease [Flavobacteriales bacterium]|nr:ABC transporter permease [Flavobacteriales bacterium]
MEAKKRVIIEASKGIPKLHLRELLQYKDLFLLLAYRDYRVRYAQTFLGLAWVVVQPLFTLLIFALVFGHAFHIDTGNVPYPLFAMCGMSAWTYFAFILNQSGNAIIGAQHIIQKIYFPRLIIPFSKVAVGMIDFLVTLVFIAVLLFIYAIKPSHHLVFLPVFVVLTVVSALGMGLWLSAITVRYRDFQHVVPFLVQLGLYISPVAYPAEVVTQSLPEWATAIYFLNPVAGIVEGFRWAILGTGALHVFTYISFGITAFIFVSGLYFFKKTERLMADLI